MHESGETVGLLRMKEESRVGHEALHICAPLSELLKKTLFAVAVSFVFFELFWNQYSKHKHDVEL